MLGAPKTLIGSIILASAALAFGAAGCVDPAGKFKEFDQRVVDAGMPAVGSGCMGGVVPDVTGEFYLNLSTSLNPSAHLNFIFTTAIDLNQNPAQLSLTLQPLCSQAAACDNKIGEPVGDTFTIPDTPVDENCDFDVDITDAPIPGAANSISGADVVGVINMKGNLQSTDFYCGIASGEASGTPLGASTFGASRVPDGTVGSALPEGVAECPPAI